MLRIEMLAAERGDALLVEYGPGDEVTNRVLIDGGPVNSGNYDGIRERLSAVPTGPDGRRWFDLLVITHVDTDHVEGVIRLLQDTELRCVFDDVWFNGWHQLTAVDPSAGLSVLGPKQGEFLGALLQRQGRPWNQLVRGGPIVVPDDGDLPEIVLRGGLRLTLLSPTVPKLERLARVWERVIRETGFEPGDEEAAFAQFEDHWWATGPVTLGDDDRIRASNDNTEANGSSIAFLAELGSAAVLLAGDAHDDALTSSLRRLRAARGISGPLRLDALKLSHHGSKNNLSEHLLAELECDRYLVSTSGNRFGHPDAIAIRRLIERHRGPATPILLCNYRQAETEIWADRSDVDTQFEADAVVELAT